MNLGHEHRRFSNSLTQRIADFIEEIGIPVRLGRLEEPTFLPGVSIEGGELIVDESRLLYPGDLLHEAGHIAVMAPEVRGNIRGNLGNDPGDEMAAIAWSWAALKRMELNPEIVFHAHGYHGGSEAIIRNFSTGRYFGVPLLIWFGMIESESSFPAMLSWLRTA